MGRATLNCFWPRPLGPWGGVKRSNIIKFNYKVNFKDLCTKLFLCSLKWKIQSVSDGIFILAPELCPGVVLWGAGCPGGQKLLFQTWSCGISNLRGCRAEQNASTISSYGQTGDLGVRSKGQISLNFDYQVKSKFFVPNFVCVLTNKRYKHIE